jgi:sporulation protein YlmC with PRC-barrel domain
MEYTFRELKKKSVINVLDGKKLGKITDMEISFPCSRVVNFTVSPSLCSISQDAVKIIPCEIQRVGEDAILIKPCVNEISKEEVVD